MKECPEIREIAHQVETGEGSAELVAHLRTCDACQEARASLEDEATSLMLLSVVLAFAAMLASNRVARSRA